MKLLLISSMLLMVSLASAKSDDFSMKALKSINGNLVFLSNDCSTIYYSSNQFKYESTESDLAYSKSVVVRGADKSVSPLITARLTFTPTLLDLSDAEKQVATAWATDEANRCENRNFDFVSYPQALVSASQRVVTPVDGFSVTHVALDEGKLSVSIEIRPLLISADRLLQKLKFLGVATNLQHFESRLKAYAKLSLSVDAASNFVMNSIPERICRSERKCLPFDISRLSCRRVEHCDDMTRIVQDIKDLSVHQQSVLDTYLAPGMPEWKLNELIDQLMSRFMISNYNEKSKTIAGDVATITLGKMHKEITQDYHDEVSTDFISQDNILQPIITDDFSTLIKPQIDRIYQSSELTCLVREAKRGATININNKCFRK